MLCKQLVSPSKRTVLAPVRIAHSVSHPHVQAVSMQSGRVHRVVRLLVMCQDAEIALIPEKSDLVMCQDVGRLPEILCFAHITGTAYKRGRHTHE